MAGLTLEQLRAKADSGDTAAQVSLSRLLDQQGDHSGAVAWLRRAAKAGDPTAQTFLGVRLITGRAASWRPQEGGGYLVAAAEKGGPAAQRRAAAVVAVGVGVDQDWDRALDLLSKAAEGGDADARIQIGLLTGDRALGDKLLGAAPASANTIRAARRAVDIAAWLTPPEIETRFETPRIRTLAGFLPSAVCRRLCDLAAGRLQTTQVHGADQQGDRSMDIRTSSGAGFSLVDSDVVLALVRARMAAAVGVAVDQFEPVNLLRYEIGQEYRPHFDYFNTDLPHFARIVAQQGQREATVLVYLNDDYEGGETAFPELEWAFKARAGDALIFFNVDEAGAIDPRTLHAGLPPTSGEKWLLSQWVRDRTQPVV